MPYSIRLTPSPRHRETFWDHVAPPVRKDGRGVGTRVPTIIVSPFVQRGRLGRTEYETVSILKLIERRSQLEPLSALDADWQLNDLTESLGYSSKPTKTGKHLRRDRNASRVRVSRFRGTSR